MKKIILFITLFSITAKAQLAGLTITGNPENATGATWTYQQTINGIVYDLQGKLFKPVGSGPFPSIIINHGTGGSVNTYSKNASLEMVTWGFVCISTNYTHSGGVPCGSPGDCVDAEFGASPNNFLRAMKCWDILASLSYTNTNCISTFGHSRGAFLTIGLMGTYPDKFICAGHTAGGIGHPTDFSFPTTAMANGVTKPYISHHGEADTVVLPQYDLNFNNELATNNVTHEYYTYPTFSHSQMALDALMFSRTKTFFQTYGICVALSIDKNNLENNKIKISPNPSNDYFQLNNTESSDIEIYNSLGQKVLEKSILANEKIAISSLSKGIYFVKINGATNSLKLIKE